MDEKTRDEIQGIRSDVYNAVACGLEAERRLDRLLQAQPPEPKPERVVLPKCECGRLQEIRHCGHMTPRRHTRSPVKMSDFCFDLAYAKYLFPNGEVRYRCECHDAKLRKEYEI